MSEVNGITDDCAQKIENKPSDYLADCEQLSATALQVKHPLTYSSWRNMKQRQKKDAVIAPEFVDFRRFLRIMGPRPGPEYSIDRLDNNNKTYGPGLCAWRSKTDQNRNKSNVIMIPDADGTTLALTEWAEKLGIPPSTLRRRRRDGWTDAEVLHGRKSRANPLKGLPWPAEKALVWEKLYRYLLIEGKRPLSLSREGFLLRKAKEKVRHYAAILDATTDPNSVGEETEKNKQDLRELNRWHKTLRFAETRKAEASRREFILNHFVPRSSGLGRARELEIARFVDAPSTEDVEF